MPKAAAPPLSLRIAILGAGKIGSAFAYQLTRDGHHDVAVIARAGSVRLQQLERDGAIIDVKGGRASVKIMSRLDEQTPYDLVIVTLLDHQIDAVLPALQRSAARCIQFMFNTFQPERLQEAVGVGRCAFGMPFVQATLTADGKLKAIIGAGGQKTLLSQQRWVDVFAEAGLPAALETDMPSWLRCHVPLCVAFESISVAGMARGGGASWNEALVLARGINASFHLIKGLGFRVYPGSKRQIARSPVTVVATLLWAISRIRSFRELLATGRAECCALITVMVEIGALASPPLSTSAIEAMKPS